MITLEEFNKIAVEDKFDDWFRDILINKKEVSGDCWLEIYYADLLNEVDKIVDYEKMRGVGAFPLKLSLRLEESITLFPLTAV